MKKLMEYKIISGRTEEIRRVMMDRGRQQFRRGTKVRKRSSLRKILQNEREAGKNLARLLNCNFDKGDLWVTLTYPTEPESWEEAEDNLRRFIRKLKREYERKTGKKLRYVFSHGKKGKDGMPTRMHHHLVLPAMDYEIITQLWPADDVTYRKLDGRGDYTGVARYMIQNAGHDIPGAQKYHPSRGLKKPVYTEPVPVFKTSERIRVPREAKVQERAEWQDMETGMFGAYVRYTRPRRGNDTSSDSTSSARRGRAPSPRGEGIGVKNC